MRRTEALQGVRMIKFRNVLDRYEASEFNQAEAAELLGVSERTFRRWSQRYDEAGEAGLLDKRLAEIPGVGPLGAIAMALTVEPGNFASARHFAA